MKNILIITSYYPFPEDKRLPKTNKAIYYLSKYNNPDENIIILNYIRHVRWDALKCFPRIIITGAFSNYKKHLYKDDEGRTVLLAEHPGIIPHYYAMLPFFDRRYAIMVNRYLKENDIELDSMIVHVPYFLAPIAKRIPAKKKVAIIHNSDIQHPEKLKEYAKDFDRLGFRSFQLQKKYGRTDKDSFLALSGLPQDYYLNNGLNRAWKPDGTLRICFAGRLEKVKNAEGIINALSLIKNDIRFELKIIGDGKEKENLINLAKEKGLSDARFLGRITREETFKEFKESDLFIMPSFSETFGLVYIEAIAAGDIIIGSKNQGLDGLLSENTEAFFVDPYNERQIADTIKKINEMDVSQVDKIKKAAYKKTEAINEEKASRLYIESAYKFGDEL